ncbi:MAG: 23S rRNA (uracil(1939)-C(5))-methyltransferase RlmD [Clostridia bacterium]|nr:23S rRNA (uracil(1939)-C(5))-methyltransferase RlmD [Clostridia bacterium]
MKKGDFYELDIIDMTKEGMGLGKVTLEEGKPPFTVFVEKGVYGETVRAGITEVKKNYAKGKVVQVLKETPYLSDSICPNIDKCGGCGYGKLNYDAQLYLKEKQVKDKLERLAGIKNPSVNPIVPSDDTAHYRNKAKVFVYNDMVGFKERKSNMVVDCRVCQIQNDRAMAICDSLRAFLKKQKQKNVIGTMVIRTTDEETMVVINRKGKADYDWISLAYDMDDACGNTLESFYVDDRCIAGKKTILDEVAGLQFEVSPLSFYQVNRKTMVKLYDKAISYLDLKGDETVLDLYCGVGTIGIFALKKMAEISGTTLTDVKGRVIGIESVKPAVIDANRNAVINGIVNARYITGKAETELPAMLGLTKLMKPNEVNELVEKEPEIKLESADYIILDPPRAGCEKDLLDAVITAKPKKISYISCDPGTLARDVKYLEENGYSFIEATPFDMFPGTTHVETVVLLSRA